MVDLGVAVAVARVPVMSSLAKASTSIALDREAAAFAGTCVTTTEEDSSRCCLVSSSTVCRESSTSVLWSFSDLSESANGIVSSGVPSNACASRPVFAPKLNVRKLGGGAAGVLS